MSTSPSTSKRRHILTSINPDRPGKRQRTSGPDSAPHASTDKPSPAASVETETLSPDDARQDGGPDTTRPRRSRLRLKRDKSHRHRSPDDKHDSSSSRQPSDRAHHRRYHRHRRRARSQTPPNPYDPEPLDPDAAFRESLFDAMADDEGAAYWEGVYGQPVHVYSNERAGPAGELEQMTDEEYAAHVRQKMWEKTHAGLLEERARREAASRKKEEDERRSRKLREEMEYSLRKGEERRQRKMWASRWDEYTRAWAGWSGALDCLPWPLESGRRGDICEKDVRLFFVRGLQLDDVGEQAFVSRLKDERVRWHPDKIQQRLGGDVDNGVMRDVTAIFQIIDRLWAESRSKV